MESLFLLTIPRFDIPEFGSLDEDYLCSEDQLEWYVSEETIEIEPVRILETAKVHEEDIEYEYTDGEFKTWYFWTESLDADCVYIRQEDVYRRCVKVTARNVLILQKKMEEEQRGEPVCMPAYRRLGRISGYSGIVGLSKLSARDCANDKELLHNEVTGNLYFLEREFETGQEMREDVKNPAPVDLRRFFEDILEQK